MNKNYLKLFIAAIIFLPLLSIGLNNCFHLSGVIQFLIWCGIFASIVLIGSATFDPKGLSLEQDSQVPAVLKRMKTLIVLLAIIFIIPWTGIKGFYNTSVSLTNQYEQKCQERPLFYDMMWKTYSTKKEIQGMSVQTFTQIASIIMDARKDGANVSWKWVQENTKIPFEEFTAFYKDLSSYIETKRQEYFNIEKECQQLAYQHNILIKSFPNNLYNTFIGRSYIIYQYGFTSDSTNKVFNNHKE